MEGKHEVSSRARLIVVSNSDEKVSVPRNKFYEGLIFQGKPQDKKSYKPEKTGLKKVNVKLALPCH